MVDVWLVRDRFDVDVGLGPDPAAGSDWLSTTAESETDKAVANNLPQDENSDFCWKLQQTERLRILRHRGFLRCTSPLGQNHPAVSNVDYRRYSGFL